MNTFDISSGSKVAYAEFKKLHPQSSITRSEFKKIIYTHNTNIYEYILETGDTYKMPFGFGPLSICKYKQRTMIQKDGKLQITLPIDWVATLKFWKEHPEAREQTPKKVIYHLNAHTDGNRYKWFWIPDLARIFQSKIWEFKPSREASRALAKILKDPNAIQKELYTEKSSKKS